MSPSARGTIAALMRSRCSPSIPAPRRAYALRLVPLPHGRQPHSFKSLSLNHCVISRSRRSPVAMATASSFKWARNVFPGSSGCEAIANHSHKQIGEQQRSPLIAVVEAVICSDSLEEGRGLGMDRAVIAGIRAVDRRFYPPGIENTRPPNLNASACAALAPSSFTR